MLLRLGSRLRAAARHLQVAWHAWCNPAMTWHGKLVLVGMAVYVLSPIDIVPDWIPLLGWVDDLVLIGIVLPLFMKLLPPDVLRQAQQAARNSRD